MLLPSGSKTGKNKPLPKLPDLKDQSTVQEESKRQSAFIPDKVSQLTKKFEKQTKEQVIQKYTNRRKTVGKHSLKYHNMSSNKDPPKSVRDIRSMFEGWSILHNKLVIFSELVTYLKCSSLS